MQVEHLVHWLYHHSLVENLLLQGYQVKALCLYNSFNSWGWLDSIDKDKLSEILNNSKLIETNSKGAYEMSLKYDWKKVINQWDEVIEELK